MSAAHSTERPHRRRWNQHYGKLLCGTLLVLLVVSGRWQAGRSAVEHAYRRWSQATIGALAPPPLPRRTPTPTPPPLRVPVPSDTMPIPLPWQQLPGFPPEWAPGGGLPVTPPTPPLIAPAAEPTSRPAWARPPRKE